MKKAAIIFILLVILAMGIGWFFLYPLDPGRTGRSYSYEKQPGPYPMKGYAPFCQWYPWEDIVDPELIPELTLSYAGILWKEWEPEKGQYDFAGVEEKYHLDSMKKDGSRVILRVLCDMPSETGEMGIPQWLYDEIEGQGTWYDHDGEDRGFSPDYNHPAMLQAHEALLKAISSYYGEDFIAYIEMGTVGQYGEWHTSYGGEMPTEETMKAYTEQYRSAFPNTKLMFRRPFQASLDFEAGYYNDMLGTKKSTDKWLGWLNSGDEDTGSQGIAEFWNRGPVGGEFSHGDPYMHLAEDCIEDTIRQIQQSHMSFIGPCTPREPNTPEEMDRTKEIQAMLGYDVYLKSMESPEIFQLGTNEIRLEFENRGIAPLFMNLQTEIYLLNEAGDVFAQTEALLDFSQVHPGKTKSCSVNLELGEKLPEQTYHLTIRFRDSWTEKVFPLSNATSDQGLIPGTEGDFMPRISPYYLVKNRMNRMIQKESD